MKCTILPAAPFRCVAQRVVMASAGPSQMYVAVFRCVTKKQLHEKWLEAA